MNNSTLYSTAISSLEDCLPTLLDAVELSKKIGSNKTVLIKPNLVEALLPPITTPVYLVRLLIDYLLARKENLHIIIGEGTGSLEYDTYHNFKMLGYTDLAVEKSIQLIDLNEERLTKKENCNCLRWPIMHLPAILDEVFLLSIPMLKAHTLTQVTLTMKNMMGCAPPSHFRGQGNWGKSAFHEQIHEAIFDLNRYRTPDFTLLDASVGMAQAHLWGRHCEPPVNQLVASTDPVAIDAYGATLLGRNWRDIKYIRLADTILGSATEPVERIPS
jgi:uncharacterized protein (DUF362 family)